MKNRPGHQKTCVISITVPVYGLPANTDVDKLQRLAASMAASLEGMGCYGQRLLEPAHLHPLFLVDDDE